MTPLIADKLDGLSEERKKEFYDLSDCITPEGEGKTLFGIVKTNAFKITGKRIVVKASVSLC